MEQKSNNRLEQDAELMCYGEERAWRERKKRNLSVDLHPHPHLWQGAVGSDQMNEIADTAVELASSVGVWALPWR